MVTYTRFAVTVLLLALQLSQVLGGVASCGSVAGTSRLIPPPQDAPLTAASDLALDTWADLLWIAAGDTLHQLRYSTGEHIMTLELPAAGGASSATPRKLGRPTSPALSSSCVAGLGSARVAIASHEQASIFTFGAHPATGRLAMDGSIPTPSPLHSLTYCAASKLFYAVPASQRSTILQINDQGEALALFGPDSDLGELLASRGGQIDSVHFSVRDGGSLHLLCTACGSVMEVSLSGDVIRERVLDKDQSAAVALSGATSVKDSPAELLLLLPAINGRTALVTVCLDDKEELAKEDNLAGSVAWEAAVASRRLLQALVNDGYDYAGQTSCKDSSIDIPRTVSLTECEAACTANPACRAFTYNPPRQDCYLKATCNAEAPNDDDVSAIKRGSGLPPFGSIPAPTPAPTMAPTLPFPGTIPPIGSGGSTESSSGSSADAASFELAMNLACKDPSIADFRDFNRTSCEVQCAANPRCTAYTFNTRTMRCFLKSVCNQQEPNADDISGFKGGMPTGPSPTFAGGSNEFQTVENVACKDPSIADFRDFTRISCEVQCTANPRCTAYTFNTRTMRCFLKSVCNQREPNADDVSGFKGGIPTGPSPTSFAGGSNEFQTVENVSCKDPSIADFRGMSQAGCEAECAANASCIAYTFNRSTGRCFLKAVCDQREQNNDDVTGVKLGGGPPSSEFDVEENLSCKDPTLTKLPDVTQAVCEAACGADERCVAYTFNTRTIDCYTKAACSLREVNEDDVTGFKVGAVEPPAATPSPETPTYLALIGVLCNDANLAPGLCFPGTQQTTHCESLCSFDPRCAAFVYDEATQECCLKGSCDDKSIAPGTTSYVRPGFDPASLLSASRRGGGGGYEYFDMTSCKDPSLDIARDVSFSECETRCTANSQCTAFTYNTRKQDCFLKTACLDKQPNNDDVSAEELGETGTPGPALLPPPSDFEFRIVPNLSCKDPSIDTKRNIDQNTCAAMCAIDTRCTHYTYNTRTGACFLKAVCINRESNPDDVSGVKIKRADEEEEPEEEGQPEEEDAEEDGSVETPAPTEGPTSGFRTYFGIECADPEILALPGFEGAPACKGLCAGTPSCAAYTMYSSTSTCALKFACDERVLSFDAISGVFETSGPAPAAPAFNVLRGIACGDNSIRQLDDSTETACQGACAMDTLCRAFTFNMMRNECSLKATCSLQQTTLVDVSGLQA